MNARLDESILSHEHLATVAAQHYLNGAPKTTMTQNQRKELVRIVAMKFSGEHQMFTIEQVASMNDRQLGLAWLRMCDYITEGQYQREFEACKGQPIFLDRPKA